MYFDIQLLFSHTLGKKMMSRENISGDHSRILEIRNTEVENVVLYGFVCDCCLVWLRWWRSERVGGGGVDGVRGFNIGELLAEMFDRKETFFIVRSFSRRLTQVRRSISLFFSSSISTASQYLQFSLTQM